METGEPEVLVEQDGGVLVVTLNRPRRRNAINVAVLTRLREAFERADEDDSVRAVLLRGAGPGFCAGADLMSFAEAPTPEDVRDYLETHYAPLIGQMVALPVPILAAVNGVAAGAGASLALACDLRVMAEDAALLQAFINIGLVPDAGGTYLLARQVGYSRAFELAISGEPLPAARCLELGLCNRVVAPGELEDEAMAWARQLARRPTRTVGLTKRALHRAMTSTIDEAIAFEARMQMEAVTTEDHVEGITAFVMKREPEFKGR